MIFKGCFLQQVSINPNAIKSGVSQKSFGIDKGMLLKKVRTVSTYLDNPGGFEHSKLSDFLWIARVEKNYILTSAS